MNSENRPDPDALLRALESREKFGASGQLRIFLGMSAGVGKTYAMLRAAHHLLNEGVDVIIGTVDTHGRPETLTLTKGLPTFAKKKIEYRSAQLEEFDLDGILKRAPELVIVDELAHSNVPGSRHKKRYQDVLELLDAGINVYTAFNVQHLESRKEAVEAITGISIQETVPDAFLERAAQVELIDIAPSELLKRLAEGKVYLGDQATVAAKNFFKEDTLTALREIALRMTAEIVDQDLRRLVGFKSARMALQTNERLLVAVSHSPYSEKLIRATRRLAYRLEAPWYALHVNDGRTLGESDQNQLLKNLNLARELKAEVLMLTDVDIASAVQKVCRDKSITQVIVGRPTKRLFRDAIEGGNLLDKLLRKSTEFDVHVLRQETPRRKSASLGEEASEFRSSSGNIKYWYTFCTVAMVALLGGFLNPWLGYRSVGFIFLLAVIVVGMFGSIGAVIFGAGLSALVWDFFFISPQMELTITNTEDVLMCVSFFVVALITGFLTNRVRNHERIIREREERTNVLYEVLQDIANATEKSDFLSSVTTRVGDLLDSTCGVILKSEQGKLDFSEAKSYTIRLNEKDQAVALWSFDNGKAAGWSTETLAESRALYLPLKGTTEVVGVFVYQPTKKTRKLDLEKQSLLLSIVGQLGLSIEKHFLTKRLLQAQRLKDSEELHQTLLNSISHEIKTPLTAILGAATALENTSSGQSARIHEISQGLTESGERLSRVIENLLDMSRLNSGVLSLKREWHDLGDLLGVVIQKLQKPLAGHKLKTELLDGPRLIQMDFRLMEHALSNLILNATMYTPPGSEIVITEKEDKGLLSIEIKDDGPGIPETSLEHVFEKFYRVPGSPTGGTGLGLSIVKSIVELHKGVIHVQNIKPHGAAFTIELPLERQPPMPEEFQT